MFVVMFGEGMENTSCLSVYCACSMCCWLINEGVIVTCNFDKKKNPLLFQYFFIFILKFMLLWLFVERLTKQNETIGLKLWLFVEKEIWGCEFYSMKPTYTPSWIPFKHTLKYNHIWHKHTNSQLFKWE